MSTKADLALFLFHQGTNYQSQGYLGAHNVKRGRGFATIFRVWAPNALEVSVVGDFNEWDTSADPMSRISEQGVWECTTKKLQENDLYKFCITAEHNKKFLKADPYAFYCEEAPNTASKYFPSAFHYDWSDEQWIEERNQTLSSHSPVNIYEMHLGSWCFDEENNPLSYRELAPKLCDYVSDMGYTHIELMPITEHPFGGSWGYQVTGFFAPTSRYGSPDDLKYFIDYAHSKNIGVILDWVGGHFPKDAHGLATFDGETLYEYKDQKKGYQPQWGTCVFDFGRNEVQSFLISSALFWIENFHVDGLRVDAVASMLYLDYGRRDGEWSLNEGGGRENLEAVAFIKKLNTQILSRYRNVIMIAEESTAWPLVTAPPYVGGLGFTYKWNMGWMNDTLTYIELDPIYRSYNHDKLTFGLMYAFSENFILPISHDEVVHGKRSLLDKMPGDYWRKFAGTRAFLGYMMSYPGKKLNFMGYEFGQFIEWDYENQLDWLLLDYPAHQSLKTFVKELNHLYKNTPPLYEIDDSWDGFRWIVHNDSRQNILGYLRFDDKENFVVSVINFSPNVRSDYRLGVPKEGEYIEILNSDLEKFGGSGVSNPPVKSEKIAVHNSVDSISITVPPLSAVYFILKKD